MSDRVSLYLKRLEENKGSLLNRFSLAQAYFETGDYQNAIEHLYICVKQRDDWMLAFLLLGKALIANGQKKDACSPLEKTIFLAQDQGHDDPGEEAKNLLAECSGEKTE